MTWAYIFLIRRCMDPLHGLCFPRGKFFYSGQSQNGRAYTRLRCRFFHLFSVDSSTNCAMWNSRPSVNFRHFWNILQVGVPHSAIQGCRSPRQLTRSKLVSWCFEPSHPQRITIGLNTNFTLSRTYSFHKSSYHMPCFLSLLVFRGTQHGNLHPAGWPISFCGPTQEPCVSHSQHRRNRERFWKEMQVNGPEGLQ